MNCTNCGQELDAASRFCKFCGAATPAPGEMDEDLATASRIRVGDLLEGKWRIEKKLGQGGMGSVYLAHDQTLDRKVAIKVLAADLCGDNEFSARFEREARLTANLEHPNVVLVYAVGKHFGRPFIVMKCLEGMTLGRHLRQKGKLSKDEVLAIYRQLCSGLGYIHQRGFVHRDIKAGNIYISPEGHCTILDFGILRDTKSKEGLTRAGVMMGTPHYMSPEQALGKPIDARADLYALGVLLYECITGNPPYSAETELRLIEKHLKSPPPDPCIDDPSIPKSVGLVLKKTIAKKRDERYQTAEELFAALEAAYKTPERRTPTRKPAVRAPVDEGDEDGAADAEVEPAVTEVPGATRETRVVPEKSSLGTKILGVVGLATVGLLAFLAWEMVQRSQPKPETTGQSPLAPIAGPKGPAELPPYLRQPKPEPAPEPAPGAIEPTGEAAVDPTAAAEPDAGEGLDGEAVAAADPSAGTGEAAVDPTAEPAETEQAPDAGEEESAGPTPGAGDPPAGKTDEPAKVEPRKAVVRSTEKKAPTATTAAANSTVVGGSGLLRVITTAGGEPFWATVTLDGKKVGETPISREVGAGPHTVVIERPGFKTVTRSVNVPASGVAPVKVELEPE